MNDLQKKLVDMLAVAVDICNRLGLEYYLVCGSALGAAKYQGFIPWDDDLDIGLPRPDYEKFLALAPSLLPDHLFLQNYKTDPQFPHFFSKIRDSSTTLIESGVSHLDINHGIALDVFPLDGYPTDKKQQDRLERQKKIFDWMRFCALGKGEDKKVELRNSIFRFFGFHRRTARTLEKMNRRLSAYSPHTSEIWANHGNWQGRLEYAPRWHYGQGAQAMFEGIPVIIPENYDAYLTQKYGTWRSDPPIEKQVSHHNYLVCDVKNPYTKYVK